MGGLLTLFYNLVGCVFFCVFFIPDIGTVWMNYVLVISSLVCIPAVLLTKESYRRLDVDDPNAAAGDDILSPYSKLT